MPDQKVPQLFMFILNISYPLAVKTDPLQNKDFFFFCLRVILREKIAAVKSKALGVLVLCSSCHH